MILNGPIKVYILYKGLESWTFSRIFISKRSCVYWIWILLKVCLWTLLSWNYHNGCEVGADVFICVYKDVLLTVYVYFVILQTISSRFYPYAEIETDAVFSFDEDSLLTTDEVCQYFVSCSWSKQCINIIHAYSWINSMLFTSDMYTLLGL